MKQIPISLVLAAILLVGAEWPSVAAWSELTSAHHFLVHLLYLVAGTLVGWQTSRWVDQPAAVRATQTGVSS